MSHIIESRKINDLHLIFAFKFEKMNIFVGKKKKHRLSTDKWMSINNWCTVFDELDSFVYKYVDNEGSNTNTTIYIENNQLIFTASWAKITSALKDITSLKTNETYKHYLQIKVESCSKFQNQIKVLEDQINYLNNKSNNNALTSNTLLDNKSLDFLNCSIKTEAVNEYTVNSIATKSVGINDYGNSYKVIKAETDDSLSQNDLLQIVEEYVPLQSKDSTDDSVIYKPTKITTEYNTSQEYLPASVGDHSYLETAKEESVYYPGGKQKTPEPYNPDATIPTSTDLEQKSLYTPSVCTLSDGDLSHMEKVKKSNDSNKQDVKSRTTDVLSTVNQKKSSKTKVSDKKRKRIFSEEDSMDDFQKIDHPHKKHSDEHEPVVLKQRKSKDLFSSDSDQETCIPSKISSKTDEQSKILRSHLSRKPKYDYKNDTSKQSCTTPSKIDENDSKIEKIKNLQFESSENNEIEKPIKSAKLDKWLSKEMLTKSNSAKKKRNGSKDKKDKDIKHVNKESPAKKFIESQTFSLDKKMTKKELKEFNAKHNKDMKSLKAIRETMESCLPKVEKIDILNMKDWPADEIISTYSDHQHLIKDCFENYCKQKKIILPPGEQYNSVDVLDLLNSEQKLKVMEFLEQKFNDGQEGVSGFDDLFWDLILPEWVLAIFMKTYNFTRQEAVKRIKSQINMTISCNENEVSMQF